MALTTEEPDQGGREERMWFPPKPMRALRGGGTGQGDPSQTLGHTRSSNGFFRKLGESSKCDFLPVSSRGLLKAEGGLGDRSSRDLSQSCLSRAGLRRAEGSRSCCRGGESGSGNAEGGLQG